MKTIMISKLNVEAEAKRVFESDVSHTDSLEVIDTLIELYPNEIEFRRVDTGEILSYKSAHACRFDLGMDIR